MPQISGLNGKNIILVNSGGKKKRFTFEVMKKLGVSIILVNKKLDVNKKLISHFIEADTYNFKETIEKLSAFHEANPQVTFDGAMTFWEDDIPLLGKICEKFNLTGNSYQTAVRTRNKYEMRKRLHETGLDDTKFHLVKTHADLKKAIDGVGFPAILKPAWGSDSEFVVLVKNENEAKGTFEYLVKNCNEKFNPIFKYNNGNFVYEEYIDGTEVSVECYSQYGIPHVIGINEKQPIKLPYFVEYGDIAPARLDDESESEVMKLAESALIALGVQNSLAHIEIKVTPKGPRIIEVGSRMGGDDIYYNVKNVWGIDMVKTGLQIALRKTADTFRKTPKECVICRYFIPEYSGIITNMYGVKEARRQKNLVQLVIGKNVGDAIFAPPEGFDNAGWVVTRGRTYQEAETTINSIFKQIEINITRFHKDSSLGKTSRKTALSSASLVRDEILRASKIEKIRFSDYKAIKKLHIGIVSNSSVPITATEFRESPIGGIRGS
jgi:biotin carboxylase